MNSSKKIILPLIVLSVCLSACASTGPKVSSTELKAQQEAFETRFFEAAEKWLPRVYRVGYNLVSSPVPGHGNFEAPKYNFAGVGVEELKKSGRRAYNLPKDVDGVLVMGLYPGSEAEHLDLQAGDVILSVDGKKTRSLGSYFKRIRSAETDSVMFEVQRGRETFMQEVPLEKVYYNAQFFLAATPQFAANALFSKIHVGIGAIRYSRNDDELAVIMGHELAHTTLKHSGKKLGVGIGTAVAYGAVAGVIDAVTVPGVGNLLMKPAARATDAAVSRRYEREADYHGMKHAFHSGYNVESGAKVFSRLASDSPGLEVLAYTFSSHPKSPERFLRLEKIVEEFETTHPEKFPLRSSPDWELIIPVRSGETAEEALRNMTRDSSSRISVQNIQATNPPQSSHQSIPSTTPSVHQTYQAPAAPGVNSQPRKQIPAAQWETAEEVKTTYAEPNPPLKVREVEKVAEKLEFKEPLKTNEINKASLASPDTSQASGYPVPKT